MQSFPAQETTDDIPPQAEQVGLHSDGSGGPGGDDDRSNVRWLVDSTIKGGLAILDQVLISGSNFVIGILLARWLMPGQYGAYALAFAVFLLLALLYQCLLLEPMTVFGASSYRHCRRRYLGRLLRLHMLGSCLIAAGLGTSAFIARASGSDTLARALGGVAIAAPCVLLFWLARRSVYLEMSPGEAVKGASLYCGLVLGGVYVIYRLDALSPFTAFLLMAGGALITSLALFLRFKSLVGEGAAAPGMLEVWRRHWNYGRWALGCSVAGWIPAYIYYPLLSRFAGMAQAGQLRALMNLVAPIEQTLGGLSLLFLPYAARMQQQHGTSKAAQLAKQITLLSIAGTAAYWAVIVPLRVPVLRLMYSGKYDSVAYLLPWVALGSILWSAGYGPGIILRAMEHPRLVFVSLCASSVATLLVGIPATYFLGLWGVVAWGLVSANAVALLLVVYLLRSKLRSVSTFVEVMQSSPTSTSQAAETQAMN